MNEKHAWGTWIIISVIFLGAFSYFWNNSSMESELESEEYVGYTSFEGYECTDDCSGHEAGYSWAEENYITDPSECDGNSNSFIEGCIAYTEDN